MEFIQSFFSYFSTGYEYQGLNKKDDDLGIEQANRWVSSYPISDVPIKGNDKIKEYTIRLMGDLKIVSLTSSNKSIISVHLAKISQQSERIKGIIFNELSDLSRDSLLIGDIKFRLALVNPKNP